MTLTPPKVQNMPSRVAFRSAPHQSSRRDATPPALCESAELFVVEATDAAHVQSLLTPWAFEINPQQLSTARDHGAY